MTEFATVPLHKPTKEKLSKLRQPGESFDAALNRIIDQAAKAEEAAFFAELDALASDRGALVPLDDVWPTN